MIDYLSTYQEKLLTALVQHLQIVGITLIISILLAFAITLLSIRSERLVNAAIQIFSVIYSIPSLALFAILIPIMGIGRNTAIFVLVLYNQFLLLRNIMAGLKGVDEPVLEAALGMGMNQWQILYKVKLPLALPVIMAGIHLAIISTIGIATIAATINAGGLGTILFDGLRTMNTYKILWGTIFCAGIAWAADGLLQMIESILYKKVGFKHEL
ncbi:ABC transporter permease [Lacrimispora sp.]|jgi:osmoprotectant transport system permease protein|uniref:ABC transporter permease n=1 Tax=Lacrimispora sp. TaxID=2719234 RepID=UPI00289AEE4E|nr:ABC transporter permease [Lacrimispora sp.]